MSDDELAADLAVAAGDLLMAIRAEGAEIGRELGKRGDREANALLLDRLAAARPDDFVLSEEARDDQTRCSANRVWIIDPLDGTREYGEGRDDWAVHVGLAIDGEPTAGAVALPSKGTVYATGRHETAKQTSGGLRMVVSRSRAPAIAVAVATTIGAELVAMGSAGAKAMSIVAGEADIYLHAGGQYEWDNCAPVAVARAHGLHASRLNGDPLVYNCADPLLPDLVICRADLVPMVRAAIRAAGNSGTDRAP